MILYINFFKCRFIAKRDLIKYYIKILHYLNRDEFNLLGEILDKNIIIIIMLY